MKNPLVSHLHILQLEGYESLRFLRWWIKNPFKFKLENKKALVWTSKAKFIYRLSGGLWPLMFLALLILKPYEILNRIRVKKIARKKIDLLKSKGLKVIGISGSYGKTSTKEFLFQILSSKYKVLRTPGNYNTLFSIAKVIDLELDKNYDFFLCELGSYEIGETWELCEMVDPDFAVLTGLNEQHLDRFGSLENEIEGESESVKYVLNSHGQAVVNLGNKHVKERWFGTKGIVGYGDKDYKFPWEQNIDGAKTIARILGANTNTENFKRPSHRLTLIKRGDFNIIDDAYSSNTDGFAAAIKYLKSFKGWKVVVTPGIPELGKESMRIHQDLGRLLIDIDQIILVKKNDRTRGLEIGANKNVEYIEKVTDALGRIKSSRATILFENDLPDNY